MLSRSFLLSATLAAGLALLALPGSTSAQEPGSRVIPVAELPEAPQAQFATAGAEPSPQQTPDRQSQTTPQPAQSSMPGQSSTAQAGGAAQGSSSSQSSTQQPDVQKSQHEKADEQIKEQEKQRVVGVLPQFNISYHSDAASMTAAQKMKLAFRSSIDPVAFGVAFVAAGYHEAMDDDTGFGWGIEGYGKRAGAAYLDSFDGNIIGNGILPSILHQDPRYFRLGHGTITHRLLYSLATNVVCKHDHPASPASARPLPTGLSSPPRAESVRSSTSSGRTSRGSCFTAIPRTASTPRRKRPIKRKKKLMRSRDSPGTLQGRRCVLSRWQLNAGVHPHLVGKSVATNKARSQTLATRMGQD